MESMFTNLSDYGLQDKLLHMFGGDMEAKTKWELEANEEGENPRV